MKTRKSFVGMILLGSMWGLCFRAGERHTQAAVPPPCASSPCDEVYGWWISGNPGGFECFAVEVAGTATPGPTTHTTSAKLSIFSVVATPGTKTSKTGNGVETFKFSTNSATCGKDAKGNWQTPQEVTPSGTATFSSSGSQWVCAP